ncbi:gliding motility lipoprotein GldB [Yeosuana sp. MJ-SS3]|uniref:Gliding motility lipoprotein GldB n=1 Tax=Gilvirhabdus luticola TaxID=3079858 RepID=A0ABU3U5Q0_9FLAO|nr:gliding motility lipoprotein GldB [Yeosuana sp. MJ-SS3]MDU8885736.1 gliding motility lipoprotein GldB [Yeosuana sp. MJ-SS3]
MKKLLFLATFLIVLISCKKENQIEKEIAKVDINISVERFDKLFSEAMPSDLPDLKQAYPFMFSERYSDSTWIARMNDTLQKELHEEVKKAFLDIESLEDEIQKFYQHLKYYFPETRSPRIITSTSDIDYRNKIIVTDTIVLIALDTYLGNDHRFYEGIQKYLTHNFTREQIVVDLSEAYGEKYVFQTQRKTLLDEMIYTGKLLYFKDIMIPFKSDAEKIGYTQEQLDWAEANESYIWRYFVERELLYSTDSKLPSRFINPAPFSKFYLVEIDNESPGKIGQYMGWQIVKAYMNNHDASLKEMLNSSPEDIFNNSKFKPNK